MIYTFEILTGKRKGTTFDIEMHHSELDAYCKHYERKLQRVFKMNIGDPVRLGITKPPSDFSKYVLGRVKASVPGAKVEHRWNIPKEI